MPETNSAIFEAKRRARDYWDIDGLPALVAGAVAFLWGVLSLSGSWHLPLWTSALFIGLWFFWIFLLWKRKVALEWLKSRITYPRTGYAAPPGADPKPDPYKMISITSEPPVDPVVVKASTKALEFADFPFFLLLMLVLTDIGWPASVNRWLVPLACLWMALLFWRRNKKDLPWFEIAAAVIAGLASAILQARVDRFGIILLAFGTAGMAKGAMLLMRYLRHHPAPQT
jgi:MFS family permease